MQAQQRAQQESQYRSQNAYDNTAHDRQWPSSNTNNAPVVACPMCGGTGQSYAMDSRICPRCRGKGYFQAGSPPTKLQRVP
jgi:DnaJ-class molecular chaperone